MVELACAVDLRLRSFANRRGIDPQLFDAHDSKLQALGVGPLMSFLIGGDAFADIRSWYRWQDVVASVEFIVVTRPRAPVGRSLPARSCMSSPDCACRYRRPRSARS